MDFSIRTSVLGSSRAKRRSSGGFTLMELMAVVGIIVLMASITVGGFAGIQRAMGTSTGADRFRRALNAARQQACVDGTDVFVWCIDVDKFVVCRKGGTVSGMQTERKKYAVPYSPDEKVEAWWVCDEFADLDQDSTSAYIYPSDLADTSNKNPEVGRFTYNGSEVVVKARDLSQFFEQQFSESFVFDVTARKMGKCAYPPFYFAESDNYEGWMFGIKDSDYERGSFELGHEYAWPLMPIQTLPGGFVFDSSWKASTGEVDPNWVKNAYIQFYPDGRAKCGMSQFTITEAGVNAPLRQVVQIDADGRVTVRAKQ